MERNFDYDFSNKIIEYCFINENFKQPEYKLEDIVASATNSIIVYDTNEYILKPLLKLVENNLNHDDILIVGLVNDKSLLNLKNLGVRNGFFRSTNEISNAAIIIIDKKEYFVAFDENSIFKIKDDKYLSEIFNYINHVIWTKTMTEYCQGNLNTVKETRLSVIEPQYKAVIDKNNHKYSTKEFESEIKLIFKEDNLNSKVYVLNTSIPKSYSDDFERLYVNLFKDCYYPIENWDSLIKSKSYSNVTYDELVGKTIWKNGKTFSVNKEDSISRVVYKPLDEYKKSVPNYDEIAKEYNGYCKTLHIHVEIKPLKLDSSYKIYESYSKIKSYNDEIDSSLEKIIKMSSDERIKKQLDSIIDTRLIKEKITKYNNFIDELKVGDEILLNNKSKFKKINFDENELIVPSEILGKLYSKDKRIYFALNDESKIEQAKEWLKENKMEAVLILG